MSRVWVVNMIKMVVVEGRERGREERERDRDSLNIFCDSFYFKIKSRFIPVYPLLKRSLA